MRRLTVLAASIAVLLVGVSASPARPTQAAEATQGRWVVTDLGTLGGKESVALAINERGQIVGWADTMAKDKDGTPFSHAFLRENGTMRDLGTLGGQGSWANAINERGLVVGSADTEATFENQFGVDDYVNPAFLWGKGKMRGLGTLGGRESEANAINERGQIVGSSKTKSGALHAFHWQNGKLRDLGARGKWSRANAINKGGTVVGAAKVAVKPYRRRHAVLWTFKR